MNIAVKYECVQGIALITICNPPVNALSHVVRKNLLDCIKRFDNDDDAQVAVICGSGKLFTGGADIEEFAKPPLAPYLPDVIMSIEQCSKAVVAALHGTALGGGLEVAMGAHYRIAQAHTTLGVPEIKLGLIPGAGGTQRLPRLVGVDKALSMISSGQAISAEDALQTGLIDQIVNDDDMHAAGIAFARELLAGDAGLTATQDTGSARSTDDLLRRTGDMPVTAIPAKLMSKWQATLADSEHDDRLAHSAALKAIGASLTLSFADGLKEENRLFAELLETSQCSAMIHAFFAERKVGKLAEIVGVKSMDITHIGVVGGGTMGSGIATAALLSGFTVSLVETDTQSANKARSTIGLYLDGAVRRGSLDVVQREELESKNLSTGSQYNVLAEADLIIEAVFEDFDIKKDVFQAIDAVAKPDAILATNTSYLDVDSLANCTKRPEAVMGLHFFCPAHVMKLVEVVAAKKTRPELIATGFALARRLGKVAVRAGVCDGFIGNRLLSHCRTAINHMVLDGASPYQIDKALTAYGFAMGPFAVIDLAGLDINYAERQRRSPIRHQRERYPNWADDLYHAGRLGQKTGKGYYLYSANNRKGVEDPYVEELVAQSRHEAGLKPRDFSNEEIVTRYMSAMINEAAQILEEGTALRPSDIDVVLLHGYGFPRWKGGPMHTADCLGLPALLQNIQLFAKEDDYFWQSAPLLERLVSDQRNFNSLN